MKPNTKRYQLRLYDRVENTFIVIRYGQDFWPLQDDCDRYNRMLGDRLGKLEYLVVHS